MLVYYEIFFWGEVMGNKTVYLAISSDIIHAGIINIIDEAAVKTIYKRIFRL